MDFARFARKSKPEWTAFDKGHFPDLVVWTCLGHTYLPSQLYSKIALIFISSENQNLSQVHDKNSFYCAFYSKAMDLYSLQNDKTIPSRTSFTLKY